MRYTKVEEARRLKDEIWKEWNPKLMEVLEQRDVRQRPGFDNKAMKAMAHMAHIRALYEAATVGNVHGRGAHNPGNNPGASGVQGYYGAAGGERGSGEVYQSLFGVFIELFANTLAFDMVPTVPMSKSSGAIHIVEPIYGGGRLASAEEKPLMIKVKATKNGNAPALAIGTTYTLKTSATAPTNGEEVGAVTFVGKDRIHGNFIFKLGAGVDNSGAGGNNWNDSLVADWFDNGSGIAIYTTAADYWAFDADSVDYVEGFTNFVGGFSGAGNDDTNAWFQGRSNGTRFNQPMSRNTGEHSYYRSMGIRQWHTNFEAKTAHVDIEYTTEQVQDMQMDHGIDVLALGETVILDQVSQHMNDHILSRIFQLGWQHHHDMHVANGFNLNLVYNSEAAANNAAATYIGGSNTPLTIGGAAGVLPNSGAISEDLSSLQRRLISRLTYASNVINNRGRRGRGDFAVMNTKFVSAIQDIRGFDRASFENDISYNGLNMVGKFNGIRVYEDPMMDLSDGRVAVGRTGTEADPGIKFCPYILAEKIETIAEGTMAPKQAVKSRYAVVDAGSEPQLNYLTFQVDDTDAGLV